MNSLNAASTVASNQSNQSGRIRPPGSLAIKAAIRSILTADDFERALFEFGAPPEKIISPLLSFLCSTDERVRWRAVRAVGLTVARIAQNSMEPARNIMRRLIWSLNDESGGIGWGAPEAMGEIMAEQPQLACEFYCILLSYIDDEQGNPLDNDLLEHGVLWAIGRLAQKWPDLAAGATENLIKRLDSPDPLKRGISIWALGFLMTHPGFGRKIPEPLFNDRTELRIFENGELKARRISEIAETVFARTSHGPNQAT